MSRVVLEGFGCTYSLHLRTQEGRTFHHIVHMEDRLLEVQQLAEASPLSRCRARTQTCVLAHHLGRVPVTSTRAKPGTKEMEGKDSPRDKKKELKKEERGKGAS